MKNPRHAEHNAGTLVVTLATLAGLSVLAAISLQRVAPKFRMAHQNAAWQEARVAAEAGIDAAMEDLLRNTTGTATGTWPGWKQSSNGVIGPVLPGTLTPITSIISSLLGAGSSGAAMTPQIGRAHV